MRWRSLVPVLAVVLTACGSHPPTTPSSTAPPSTGSGAGPTAAIDVKADAAGSRDAIASLSEVIVDASGSTGTGLTFAIDFGDGASATSASTKHVYATPSTYTITATVTDSQGRKANATKEIAVRDVTGKWFQAGFVAKTTRVEVRNLSIDAQTGTIVRGIYRVTGNADRAFTGTLIAPRDIRMATNDGVSLIGTVPGRINDEAAPWTLIAQGDSADGQRLDFNAIVGDPTDAPPKADLKLRFDGIAYFDGSGQMPIVSLTPVLFDGTASRGSGLTSFIEFGDGTASAGPQAMRTVETGGTARLTVVDRFGRSDVALSQYSAFSLLAGATLAFWRGGLWFMFTSRNGVNYTGRTDGDCSLNCSSVTATAALSGVRDIRISVPSQGVSFQGTLERDHSMTLVQVGGANDGRKWRLFYWDTY